MQIPTLQEYFDERMKPMGVNCMEDPNNQVQIWQYDPDTRQNVLASVPIFRPHKKGIEILVYTLDRNKIRYKPSGKSNTVRDYSLIRLSEPVIRANGDVQKYQLPFGQGTHPFFPPTLVDKYDQSTPIKVLYLTEGYFKAFMAQQHGIDCIGVPSITCLRDQHKKLHPDILLLIERCQPERIVWLTDGDCKNITGKEISEEKDLAQRPNGFYRTINTFQDLLSGVGIRLYWAHISSEMIKGKPKGLDDLLIKLPDERERIVAEFHNFELSSAGRFTGSYQVRFEITHKLRSIYQYFLLHDVTAFYHFHCEARPDLKGKTFTFFGSRYLYEEQEQKCKVIVPSAAGKYFRVGDTYYEFISIPDPYSNVNQTFHRRKKETITDDHGKQLLEHVPKYDAFCNIPSHDAYQRVIHNCFNLYAPFRHEPLEGGYDTTLAFVRHIFGTEQVQVNDTVIVPRYELGLDYLTILYKYPQQILPILCLVSRLRQTGKTTFNKWLKQIFEENMAIVGNADLSSDFNAHWANKLIVACDETKIDKQVVVERVKSLSTATEIILNAKSKDQAPISFFAKFILNSNNEDNFVNIDGEEIRFWVINVPPIEEKNVSLLSDLQEEIPAFLHFLESRSMVTQNKERHWFESKLLITGALQRVIANSKPGVEQQLRVALSELFIATGLETIQMGLTTIAAEILKKPQDKVYIKQILERMGYQLGAPGKPSYPRLLEVSREGNASIDFIMVRYAVTTRCYTFERKDFVDPQEAAYLPEDLPVYALAS